MGKKCYAVKAGYRAKTAIKVKFAVSKQILKEKRPLY